MDKKILSAIGLSEAESLIYTTLLKIGSSTVKEISKNCGFHRTNIYDIIEQLREKGLVTYHKEGKIAKYQASSPDNLMGYLKEKEDLLEKILPELKNLSQSDKSGIDVEVYKGVEGMKAMFRDILRENKTLYAFGVKGQLREYLPEFAEQWIRIAKKQKLKYYTIYTTRDFKPKWFTEIRYVDEELSSPVATFIYGDKICINIWNPNMVAIIINSKLVASMYKKHFDLLWKIAKKI